ncbi:SMR family transporter [Brevundimonas sp. NPDC092305]|uniref:SMR family transporter n=1 Tax=Brevundimonas sp. NPDC092305 TaxID=3363957 RepID=UPI003823B454
MNPYLLLGAAIVLEVIATSAMKASAGFTRPGPSMVTVIGYVLSFSLLAQVLKTLPTGVAYAIWCGVGIILITLVSWIGFGQRMDGAALAGMTLIVAGVAVINLFSTTATAG